MPYAHSANDEGNRHDLVEHLRGVAQRASKFATPFGAGDLAYLVGLWHDLGKFNPRFQSYLMDCEAGRAVRGPDHKAAGALLAARYVNIGSMLVQGHHGGLRWRRDFETWLAEKTKELATSEAFQLAREVIPDLEPDRPISLPAYVNQDHKAGELLLRLLFSALVDADFLDTETHFNPQQAEQRYSQASLQDLWQRFNSDQKRLSGHREDAVGQVRHCIYKACLSAADGPTGMYRLTVPTGGGKTRSAMAFALRHAIRHNLERVVVVVPFISITEQTAEVYRRIFETDRGNNPVVLEHHSAVITDDIEDGDFRRGQVFTRLAAENWDARIVVTTTVQLFESLFSNLTSRTRKLHNLACSVIILDEAQALPAHLLTPILDVLQELCAHYGSTVVLSTATQPAFEAIPVFSKIDAKEIVPNPTRYFETLRRVDYEWRIDPALKWSEVAEILQGEPQTLAVVNTKKDALALLDALEDPGAFHLSTMLCGAHRRDTINEIKRRLCAGESCHLVSTQVIEAGVDLDFPLVMRALGPLDGIIQAAGRCNREGNLPDRGRVVIFRPVDGRVPSGAYRTATDITTATIGKGNLDPDDPAGTREYFRQLFETIDTDQRQVQTAREALDYPKVAQRFRMIDENTQSVVITSYGPTDERQMVQDNLKRLRRGASEVRVVMRRLQPYLVSVYFHQIPRLRQQGLISEVEVMEGLWEWRGEYHPVRGIGGVESIDPETLIV